MADPHNHEGVPLNVWILESATATDGSSLRRCVAERLIETYSPPAGVVVDLVAAGVVVLDAAIGRGRSAVLGLRPYACARPATESLSDTADLVVCLPPANHLEPPRDFAMPAVMVESVCRRAAVMLRPGGFFVLASVGRGTGALDPATRAVTATSAVGLDYFQHVVVLLGWPAVERAAAVERRIAHADLVVARRPA